MDVLFLLLVALLFLLFLEAAHERLDWLVARLVADACVWLNVRVGEEEHVAQFKAASWLHPRYGNGVVEAAQGLHVQELKLREELAQSIPNAEARHYCRISSSCRVLIIHFLRYLYCWRI